MSGINRTPRVSEVADNIHLLINSRGFQAGDKLLTEKELCEEFNVGRSTIREALRILETMNVVVRKPGKGAFVASEKMSQELQLQTSQYATMTDYCEIRLALEPLAVRLAVRRAVPEEIAEIAHAESFFIQAAMKKDAQLMTKYDELYHRMIANATHNPLMIDLFDLIQNAVHDMRLKSFMTKESPDNTIEPHEEILKAIYQHDEEGAATAMAKHIQLFMDEVNSNEAGK